jgi:hypothetical protein
MLVEYLYFSLSSVLKWKEDTERGRVWVEATG